MEEPSAAYRAALGRLEAAAPGTRRAEVDALIAHAETDPDRRQPVTDAVCSWLRTAPVDAAAAEERHAVLQPLIDRLRAGGPAPWDGISVDLSGCTLGDADFSGCRLDAAEFADTRFHGTAVFAGAAFADAAFQRAVFYGDAVFTGARFGGDAEFGRARFRPAGGLHRRGVLRDGLVRPGRRHLVGRRRGLGDGRGDRSGAVGGAERGRPELARRGAHRGLPGLGGGRRRRPVPRRRVVPRRPLRRPRLVPLRPLRRGGDVRRCAVRRARPPRPARGRPHRGALGRRHR
ncbi:pentapeptide repeat-containing protein [Actinomadura madurae]|nr:pentapeptide repeat-containing protein [Actinomadura madurae]MCP9955241.1 pentapeptide repeat-containing protein [Actinomadura madurae]